jgi:hypothetical protein
MQVKKKPFLNFDYIVFGCIDTNLASNMQILDLLDYMGPFQYKGGARYV